MALERVAEQNTIFCRICPEQKKALVSVLAESGCFAAMIGDGVNDVPALKRRASRSRWDPAARSPRGSPHRPAQGPVSRLPRAVAEGQRIAATSTVLAASTSPRPSTRPADRPRRGPGVGVPLPTPPLTLAAFLTIGIPSFVLALAPRRPALPWEAASRSAFAIPAGLAIAAASLASFFLVDTIFGGSLEGGRTAATTTLVVLSLCFILLLDADPAASTSRSRATCWPWWPRWGALRPGPGRSRPARLLRAHPAGRRPVFLALLSAAGGLVLASVVWRVPLIEQLEERLPLAGRGAHRPCDRAARDLMATPGPPHRPPHEDVATVGPASQDARCPCDPDRGPGPTSSGSTSPMQTPRSTPGPSLSRSAPSASRWGPGEVGIPRRPAGAEAADRRAGRRRRAGYGDARDPDPGRRTSRATARHPSAAGRVREAARGRSGLPRRRRGPAARCATGPGADVSCEIESAGPLLPQGDEPARRRPACRRHRRTTSAGSSSRSPTASTCSRSPSSAAQPTWSRCGAPRARGATSR